MSPPPLEPDGETEAWGTALQNPSFAFRNRPRLSWTDAMGAHTAALDERTLIGTAGGAGIVVADPTISRLHAEFEPRDGGVWVRDLGSRNGTFVEGVQVSGARIPDGGKVRLGSTVFTLTYAPTPTVVELWPGERFGPLVARSVAMREVFARLARIAPTDSAVLIHGETGTGKELVARAIHEASPRATQPFVIVDCAALPENLIEGELFGHAKGAYTGAVSARSGAIEAADGGTVFLDEIGELPLAMQPKLLRVLESQMVRRLGETEYRKVNVRFVSATHRDLRKMVNAGAFREDLYFRLAVLPVTIPPLRARPDDIPALVEHFLPPGRDGAIGPELQRELVGRPWLGNVRELRNFVERALALGTPEALAMMPQDGAPAAPAPEGVSVPQVSFDLPFKEVRELWLDHLEREYIRTLLARHDRNVSAVAQAAGLDRTYVYRLIRKHEL